MSRVVNNNRGFLQLLADCPAYQRQFLTRFVPHAITRFPRGEITSLPTTTFLLFSLHHHHHHHHHRHHISIVFPPPPQPPHFHCFPSTKFRKRLPTAILNSFCSNVSCSEQQSWFSSTVSRFPCLSAPVSYKICPICDHQIPVGRNYLKEGFPRCH